MQLAFVAEWDGDNEIYVIRGDGAGLRQITSNSAHEAAPVWSPDGRQIAFTILGGSNARTFTSQLHVAMADGSDVRALAPDLQAFGVEWLPSGEQLFVGTADGLYAVSAATGETTRLSRDPPGRLSPNGRMVAFAVDGSPDDRTDKLFVRNVDGTGMREVGALQDHHISEIAWRPHTDEILLKMDPPGGWPALYSVTLDGTFTKLPVASESAPNQLRWAPDGTVLGYIRRTYGTNPQGQAILLDSLYIATPDGEFDFAVVEPPAVVEGDFPIGELVWAPDGRHITYSIRSGDEAVDLHVLDICGGSSSLVIESLGFHSDPSWQPLP